MLTISKSDDYFVPTSQFCRNPFLRCYSTQSALVSMMTSSEQSMMLCRLRNLMSLQICSITVFLSLYWKPSMNSSLHRLSKLTSFKQLVVSISLGLTSRLTMLPFKSKVLQTYLPHFAAFDISKMCTGTTSCICTVNTPQILAISDQGFSMKCVKYSGNMFRKMSFSLLFMVLSRNFLSQEKKKKEPDLPADSLALKTCQQLSSVSRLFWTIADVTSSIPLIKSNMAGAYSVISTSSFMVSVVSLSKNSLLDCLASSTTCGD